MIYNPRSNRQHHDSSRIPQENVIDLRKKKAAIVPEKQSITQRVSFWQRIASTWQNWRKQRQKSKFYSRESRETVLVSENKSYQPIRTKQPKTKKIKHRPAGLIETPPREKINWSIFTLTKGWQKKMVVFVTSCLLLIMPFYALAFYYRAQSAKGEVLGVSSQAYENLQQAGDYIIGADFGQAGASFDRASDNFIQAQLELDTAGGIITDVTALIPGQVRSADQLLEAGRHIAQAGSLIARGIEQSKEISSNQVVNSPSASSLTQYLIVMRDDLQPAHQHIQQAADKLASVRIEDIPASHRDQIAGIQELLPVLEQGFGSFISFSDVLLTVLGHESPQRYLFIFQNNRELRPTGGFIGSIALLDIDEGIIKNIEVPGGGVYDIAGQLNDKIIAPKPLWLVNPHWNIQDSNWFPDFPTSAQKLMWFYERAGRTTVDGVVSMTPTVVEHLLEIVGPISMPDYDVTVTEENFVYQAQYWAEIGYDREENKPKQFISDLMPLLMQNIFSADPQHIIGMIDALYASMQRRDIMMYFTDEQAQEAMRQLVGDGSLVHTDGDYLMPVVTNIAGGKTDTAIEQLVKHRADIQADGSIINTVSIIRRHTGNALDTWEGQANVAYIRLYVPAGSELVSVSGQTDIPSFRYRLPDDDARPDPGLEQIVSEPIVDERSHTRITTEFNKTVFGNWLSIDPGEVGEMTFTYRLPFALDLGGWLNPTDVYSLYVQQQPGMVNNSLASTVAYDDEHELVWMQPGMHSRGHVVELVRDIVQDVNYKILLQK